MATELAEWVRERRRPAVLHLRCVRYLSHAGADAEMAYRAPQAIRDDYEKRPDPRHRALARLRRPRDGRGARRRLPGCTRRGARARARGRGASADDLGGAGDGAARAPLAGGRRGEGGRGCDSPRTEPLTLAQAINAALAAVLERHPRRSRLRRGRRSEGRRLRRDARAARAIRRGAGLRHAARRDLDPRPRARRGGQRASSRSPRSSTSPTSTTPRTSCAARRRRSSSSRSARTGTGWSSGSRATATSGASAGTSTTTTPSACCATSPARRRLAGAARRRRRDARDVRRVGARGRERLRLPRADRAVPHARPAIEEGDEAGLGAAHATSTSPSAQRERTATATDLTIVTWANGLHLSARVAHRLAEQQGIRARVVDLRWLAPLPVDDILREAER